MELANKFLPSVVVQIHDARNKVAFNTPMVSKKTPLFTVQRTSFYLLSQQLNHLAHPHHTGITVAQYITVMMLRIGE